MMLNLNVKTVDKPTKNIEFSSKLLGLKVNNYD